MPLLLGLLAQTTTDGLTDPWRLGIAVVALLAGYGLAYRTGVGPAEKRAEREREERIAAQEREREAYRITTPAVLASNTALDRVLAVLPSLEKPAR